MSKAQQNEMTPVLSESTRTAKIPMANIDPDSVIRIQNLEMRAKVIVEGFMSGLHRSPYHGFSVEFSDYREYSPGDDPRYLDWKLFARVDRYYIKRFEDETNLRCYLAVDFSRSIGFGSGTYDKAEYAKTLAATLAYFFSRQQDAVGLVTFAESIMDSMPARYRPGHLRRLMISLGNSLSGQSTELGKPLEQIANTVKKRGLVILISDLLAPAEDLNRKLGYLRAQGHDIMLIRVLDPAEVNFDFDNATMFQDLETGKQIYVDPQTVGEDYRKRFSEHEQEIRDRCDALGIDFLRVTTDQALDLVLFDMIQNRARKFGAIRNQPQQGSANNFYVSGGKL